LGTPYAIAACGCVVVTQECKDSAKRELPLRFTGFTVPDELFAGYGLGLDERWRALPDLHVVSSIALPQAATEAA